ncbi:MAG: MaoC/PaaZ C-terminal domain-containing protein, partial [Ilumatobacter sp.]
MSARTINGVDEMKALVGEHLGYSPYVEITQEQVNLFADATGDHQWIHIDVERAKAGPFGGPIAHGYLTPQTDIRSRHSILTRYNHSSPPTPMEPRLKYSRWQNSWTAAAAVGSHH